MIRFFVLLLGAMSFTTCSVSPEDTPGLCTLSCESAKIVGSDPSFKIIKNSNDMQFTCSANQANQALNPTLVYFTIVRSIEQINVDGTVGTDPYNQPVPYGSIEPVVNGLMSDEDSDNVNSPLIDGVRVPIRYQGIATPQSQWCSDSCGVVGVEVAFKCPAAGESAENTLQIHSGALFSETVLISVSTDE